jgi:hypothetical protein
MILNPDRDTIKTTARLTTLLSPIVTVVYGLLLAFIAYWASSSVPVGAFQGGSLLLLPFLLVMAGLAWKWPLPGGILVLAAGILVISPILDAKGLPSWYKIPYFAFWAAFMIGGLLHLVSFFYGKKRQPGRLRAR